MECDFSRGDMHQSRERGEENYNIKMLHVFFIKGMAKQLYYLHHYLLLGKTTL